MGCVHGRIMKPPVRVGDPTLVSRCLLLQTSRALKTGPRSIESYGEGGRVLMTECKQGGARGPPRRNMRLSFWRDMCYVMYVRTEHYLTCKGDKPLRP